MTRKQNKVEIKKLKTEYIKYFEEVPIQKYDAIQFHEVPSASITAPSFPYTGFALWLATGSPQFVYRGYWVHGSIFPLHSRV